MNFALFSVDGLMFLFRWLHIFFGIIWIGLLYYFNFVQGPYFGEIDAPAKSVAIQKLVPRALWWFRWGAMFTLITGVIIFGMLQMTMGQIFFMSARGILISAGALFGVVMWYNVWFIIWPNQKVVIRSAQQVASGGQPIAEAAQCGAKSGLASRHNVLFSIPLLFLMAASTHLPLLVNPQGHREAFWAVYAVILAGLEINAIKGKLGPLTSVKGVIHCGFVLALVVYVAAELLLK